MTIYDTQAHHADIEAIRYLSKVASTNQRTDAKQVFYSRQAYDTLQNQQRVQQILNTRLQAYRATSRGEKVAGPSMVALLSSLVDHAFETTVFYRKVYSAAGFQPGDIRTLTDFQALPVITKQDLLNCHDQERISCSGAQSSYISRTSGSSGAALSVAYCDQQYVESMTHYIWQLEQALGKPVDPQRWIYNIHHARWWLSSVQGQYRTFAVNDLPPLDALAAHLEVLRPQVLVTLPSYLATLAANGFDLKQYGIEAITTNSEQSSPQERRQYEALFGMPVRDEYSSVELEQIAFECPQGRHHVLEGSVYVETVDLGPDGVGTVVGTNLQARHMPMIRYNQGDLAVLAHEQCGCAAHTPALVHLHGRRNSSFLARDGRVVPSASILGIVDDFLVRAGNGVEAYRLYQLSVDEMALYHTGACQRVDSAALQQQLQRLFGHALVLNLNHVNELPQQASYKRQLLVSLLME
jgi:phenylacetate-CoA ligase